MGAVRRSDGKVSFQQEGVGELIRIDSGDVAFEFGRAEVDVDASGHFPGLPDGMCKCRHQGFVIRGRVTFKTKEGSFVAEAGEAFDVPPGHIPIYHAGSEWLQITDAEDQAKTDAAVQRFYAAKAASQR